MFQRSPGSGIARLVSAVFAVSFLRLYSEVE